MYFWSCSNFALPDSATVNLADHSAGHFSCSLKIPSFDTELSALLNQPIRHEQAFDARFFTENKGRIIRTSRTSSRVAV
jgi:hypothetical protein